MVTLFTGACSGAKCEEIEVVVLSLDPSSTMICFFVGLDGSVSTFFLPLCFLLHLLISSLVIVLLSMFIKVDSVD